MSTDTVEKTISKNILDIEKFKSTINKNIDTESEQFNKNREDFSYYYSSGSFNFMLEKGFKAEALECSELTKVPFLPIWHEGILSIHGLILPVIDIFEFARSQDLKVTKNNKNDNIYLLKLEHSSFKPLVLKLDSIPQLINTKKMKEVNQNSSKANWIKNYLENKSVKLAQIDHKKLFEQLINNQ